MKVEGFNLQLEEFCACCPDFDLYINNVQDPNDKWSVYHFISCNNIKRCTIMAENLKKRINGKGKT